MLISTKAIFLQHIPLNEKKSIVKLFTEKNGTTSFLVSGVNRSKKGKKLIFFQPLSLLDITYENKEKNSLNHLKEVRFDYPFVTANEQVHKTSILFFLNDILIPILREQESNQDLFSFIYNALQYLDVCNENTSNFHLLFMLKLSAYMGFAPCNISRQSESFYLPDKLVSFYESSFEELNQFIFTNIERRETLKTLINYYKFHFPGFKEIKSTAILEELLA